MNYVLLPTHEPVSLDHDVQSFLWWRLPPPTVILMAAFMPHLSQSQHRPIPRSHRRQQLVFHAQLPRVLSHPPPFEWPNLCMPPVPSFPLQVRSALSQVRHLSWAMQQLEMAVPPPHSASMCEALQ